MDTPTRIPDDERRRLLAQVEALVEFALSMPARAAAEAVQLRIYKEYGSLGVPEVYELAARVDAHFDAQEAAEREAAEQARALQQRQVEAMERVARALEEQTARRQPHTSQEEAAGVLPEVLRSPQAERLWEALRQAGFIRQDSYALAEGVSANQATYIAAMMNEALHLGQRWKPYRDLWGTRYMAQYAVGWQQTGKLPPRYKEIERALHSL